MLERPPRHFFEFDAFRIDVEERQLLHHDKPVLLTPKVFDILLELVDNTGHTMAKEELMNRVWPDTFVEEGNLNRNISTLRKVLGENSHRPRLIKTVPKLGYRFDGEVRAVLEEDETVTVEKRTNYRVLIKKYTTKQVRRSGIPILIFVIAAATVLTLTLSWATMRWTTDQSNSGFSADLLELRGTQDAEAFELYQQGRLLWHGRSVVGLHNATLKFEQAISRDPNFALAHSALADAYAFDVQDWTKSEASANEAIRLDPNLGEPYATIGFVRTFWEWRFNDAEPYFKRAIALAPDYATAHQWYSLNLIIRGNGGGSLAEMRRALELAPGSVAINADLCQVLYFSRKYDLAMDQCLKTLEMDPNFINAHAYLYDIYSAKEMYDEAIAEYFRIEELGMTSSYHPSQLEDLRHAYDVGGIRAFWHEQIRILKDPWRNDPYGIGLYHLRLGENEEAIRWFERAFDERSFQVAFFPADPIFHELLTNPQFFDLASKLINDTSIEQNLKQ